MSLFWPKNISLATRKTRPEPSFSPITLFFLSLLRFYAAAVSVTTSNLPFSPLLLLLSSPGLPISQKKNKDPERRKKLARFFCAFFFSLERRLYFLFFLHLRKGGKTFLRSFSPFFSVLAVWDLPTAKSKEERARSRKRINSLLDFNIETLVIPTPPTRASSSSPKERKKNFFPLSSIFGGWAEWQKCRSVPLLLLPPLLSQKALSPPPSLLSPPRLSGHYPIEKENGGEKSLTQKIQPKNIFVVKIRHNSKVLSNKRGQTYFSFSFCLILFGKSHSAQIAREAFSSPLSPPSLPRGERGTEEEKFSLRFPSENKWIKCPPSSLSLPPFSHVSYSTNTKSPPPLIPLFPHTPCENADGMRNGRRGGKSQKREKGLQKEALFSL